MSQSVHLRNCSLLMVLACLVIPASALATPARHAGLFGHVSLGAGVATVRPSGLDVLDDNETRNTLESKGRQQSENLMLLNAELGYAFAKTGTTVLAAISTEGPCSLSLRQEIEGVGKMSIDVRYERKEVWKDPYLVGSSRSRTDAEWFGFAMTWEHVLGTGAGLRFEQMNVEVDDDLIGQRQADLRRDGKETTLGVSYDWALAGAGVLTPSLSHIWIERDGKANSGRGYGVELTHLLEVGRLSYATRLEWQRTDFDGSHPIFQQKREETVYGVSEMISFAEPFGFRNWSVFGIVAAEQGDAHLTYFDSSSLLAGAGLGYRF